MVDAEQIYPELAAAFVRGCLPMESRGLSDADCLALGETSDLKLQRFKRTTALPRVRAVLGALNGLAPHSLLDIGTGRGVFLWPLLEAFPELRVTAVEPDPGRRLYLEAVSRGGVERLAVSDADATALPFADAIFDVVTVLEVLEHQTDPRLMAHEAFRVAQRFVIASVPSKPDDNPEHVQLFTAASLDALLRMAGARNVRIDYVLNHIIAIAQVDRA